MIQSVTLPSALAFPLEAFHYASHHTASLQPDRAENHRSGLAS